MFPHEHYCAKISADEKAEFIPFLNELIDAAFDEIVPRFLTGVPVETKADGTPVTPVDKHTEEILRSRIEKAYPAHGIYGEEYGIKEPHAGESVRYRWILDPIDGTKSFISNSFQFGTLIALERDTGAGFAPILSSIAHAAAGVRTIGTIDGTTMHLVNRGTVIDRELHVRPCKRIEDATFFVTSHWTRPEQHGTPHLQEIVDRCKLYRTFGDCFGYFAVASGGADLMIDPELSYWDIAALLPVVEGAGGIITSMRGGNPLKEINAVCSAGEIHGEVIAILNQP